MDAVFKRICVCQTSVGQKFLYHRLHNINDDPSLRAWVSYFSKHPDERLLFTKRLARIGKSSHSLTDYLEQDQAIHALRYPVWLYRLLTGLTIGLIAGIIFCLCMYPSALPILVISFSVLSLLNIFFYYKTKLFLENGLEKLNYFGSVLYESKGILKITKEEMKEELSPLADACSAFKRMKGKFSRRTKAVMAELAFLQDYISMIFLIDIHRYIQAIRFISKDKCAVCKAFETIGRLDAAISILSYQKSLTYFCEPVLIQENRLTFRDAYHPLLTEPVPNSGEFKRSVLVTGVNASGKSTFIKTLAINHILGLSIHTCLARHYTLKRVYVITAMAINDNIIEGDSYYIAEIKSLRRILDEIQSRACICFVDEILRGTNTAERLAATSAVLNFLRSSSSLCFFATHDTALAQSFDKSFSNYHFEELVSETTVVFDYLLKKGVAAGRNALRLLKLYQYPPSLLQDAESCLAKATPSDT